MFNNSYWNSHSNHKRGKDEGEMPNVNCVTGALMKEPHQLPKSCNKNHQFCLGCQQAPGVVDGPSDSWCTLKQRTQGRAEEINLELGHFEGDVRTSCIKSFFPSVCLLGLGTRKTYLSILIIATVNPC